MSTERGRCLVVQTAFVGDLLLSVPLLKTLRKNNPEAELWLLCRRGLGAFATESGLVDRAIEVDKGAGRAGWRAARTELLHTSFDRVYCPHQSVRSAFFVARLDSRLSVGFRAGWNRWFFHERVERRARLPDALRQLALLAPENPDLSLKLAEYERTTAPGGLPLQSQMSVFSLHPRSGDRGPEARPTRESLYLPPPPAWASMQIPKLAALRSGGSPLPAVAAEAERLGIVRGKKQTLFIAPGSVWPTKRWRVSAFTETALAYLKKDWNVVLFGAPDERTVAEEVLTGAPGVKSAVGSGLSFIESCELLALGDALLSNDSGAMHMAALSGLPTASVFGPTTLDLGYRPWTDRAAVAQRDLPCRPCGKHGSNECPLGTHICMGELTPLDVSTAIEAVVAPTRPQAEAKGHAAGAVILRPVPSH